MSLNMSRVPKGVIPVDSQTQGKGRNPGGPGNATGGLVILVLLLVLALTVAWNGYTYRKYQAVSPEVAGASLKASIYLTVLALEAEFEDTGAYPPDLESIDVAEEEVTYRPTGKGYTLVAADDESSIEFQSGDDLEPYRTAFEFLLPRSGIR